MSIEQQSQISTLYNILNELNEDILESFQNAVDNILHSSTKSDLNDTEKLPSIKLLLLLCEKLNREVVIQSEKFSCKPIFQYLDQLIEPRNKKFDLSNQSTKDLLQVITSSCNLALLHETPEDIDELVNFFKLNLKYLQLKSDVILRLQILTTFYEAFLNFPEKNKSLIIFDECELIADLVINETDDVAKHTLLLVIPQYISFCHDNLIINVIWNRICICLHSRTDKYARILLILCHLFDLSIDNFSPEFCCTFFNNSNFWRLIQLGLVHSNQMMRKQAMYLFKKSFKILENSQIEVPGEKEEILFKWNANLKEDLTAVYTELITVLEFLEEQQVHIIKPIFEKIHQLVQHKASIDLSWILLIHEKALLHDSIQVVKWSLSNLMKLPKSFFVSEHIAVKVVKMLVPVLSNMSIYYSDGITVSTELIEFFDKILESTIGKVFICNFVVKMCSLTWSPESLFFVTNALAHTIGGDFWGDDEILALKKFVSEALCTHNKIVRFGVELLLIKSVINFTTGRCSFENFVLLLSSFSVRKLIKKRTKIWGLIVDWVKISYSKDMLKKLLEKFKRGEMEKHFTERSIAVMLILLSCVFVKEDVHLDHEPFFVETVTHLFSSFQGIEKRVYLNKTLYDHYLLLYYHILKENYILSPMFGLMFSFGENIVLYIQSQVKNLSCLQDFYMCQHYISTFKALVELEFFSLEKNRHLINFLQHYINDLDKNLHPVHQFCQTKLLEVGLQSHFGCKLNINNFWTEVNKPLMKDENSSEYTKDMQVLWGRMNSEFLEAKWKILEFCITKEELSLCPKDLLQICNEALNIGGYGVLNSMMTILKYSLPELKDVSGLKETINSILNQIMERKKNDEFKMLVQSFTEMIFQVKVIEKEVIPLDILVEYSNLFLANSSSSVVEYFLRGYHCEITSDSISLDCHIMANGLVFGSVLKKEERLTVEICSLIQKMDFWIEIQFRDYHIARRIRTRCIQKILDLNLNSEVHKNFAKVLINTLIEMERNLSRKKTRYFGDSLIHRVKHRVMQALLLLEPVIYPDLELAEKVLKWLCNSLMNENPQPSVKYQQEWLFIRILLGYDKLLSEFWSYFNDDVEKKTKGLCSLITICFHLCKIIHLDEAPSWVEKAICTLVPLCMDQHFEIRLYAQVVVQKLYALALSCNFHKIIVEYKFINDCVYQSIERGCKGNMEKNCKKLQEDFYLSIFHPTEHYTLETIFEDLPRLANVGSDEWMSVCYFYPDALTYTESFISVYNKNHVLKNIKTAIWSIERPHAGVAADFTDKNLQESLINYQKKIIPLKPSLRSSGDGDNCDNNYVTSVHNEGLVVVASLIDRIPNLGGLARSCEIFGASEYVVNSLKLVQDKQFTSLSVTAEKWIRVREVKLQDVTNYILQMKKIGYTVVGAEQALYSQTLNCVKFPKKTLLLLGNEKEGIPPNLLPLLDICVEIPQIGIIRSLNVHVTGALFMWEYAKQHNFPAVQSN